MLMVAGSFGHRPLKKKALIESKLNFEVIILPMLSVGSRLNKKFSSPTVKHSWEPVMLWGLLCAGCGYISSKSYSPLYV